jgi:hypothetical protein
VSSFLEQEERQSEILNGYFPEAGLKGVHKQFVRLEEVFADNANLAILMLLA